MVIEAVLPDYIVAYRAFKGHAQYGYVVERNNDLKANSMLLLFCRMSYLDVCRNDVAKQDKLQEKEKLFENKILKFYVNELVKW